ncbi:retrotransposon protein, putative, ty1-copia subclass [Tanacetum coccineum]
MVRSMINLTTLPLSFRDYALESATRILNMVPTKKVDKTPYELWYEKVPNLSYLKDTQEENNGFTIFTSNLKQNSCCEELPGGLKVLNHLNRKNTSMDRQYGMVLINAMNAEIQSMINNMVWVLVDLPPSCKTVGSKWIFKKKTDMNGIVHTYKARLVAKGYTQLYEVDYKETFSPVADIRAIRILISIAAYYDYEIWKMDVKTAFLNGYLDENIHMVQPEVFVDPNHPKKVCKLQRFIYGLKQASRSWNKRFNKEIKRFGFAQNLDEPCVYQKASGSNVTFLILCFAMKDLGEATFILGIKIYKDRSKRLIRLGQNAYMDKILKRYKMDNSKRGHIPMRERLDLNKTQGASTPEEVKRMQNVPYASVVGSIMYDVRCTLPDVAFANTKDMLLVYGGNLEAELRVDMKSLT